MLDSQFEWEREYEKLPPLADIRDNVLVLYNVRADDGGRYICKSYMEDGRVTQNFVDLIIKREYRRRRQSNKHNSAARRRRMNNKQ